MGERGPQATPTSIKQLKGIIVKAQKEEPKYAPITNLQPPSDLNELAKNYWTQIGPMIHSTGVLTEVDVFSFRILCEVLAQLDECFEHVRRFGMSFPVNTFGKIADPNSENVNQRTPVDWKANPSAKMIASLLPIAKTYLSMFGLTPSSRVDMKSTPPKTGETVEFLLNRKAK
jgi:P27 family predicted phage terminase small subunit